MIPRRINPFVSFQGHAAAPIQGLHGTPSPIAHSDHPDSLQLAINLAKAVNPLGTKVWLHCADPNSYGLKNYLVEVQPTQLIIHHDPFPEVFQDVYLDTHYDETGQPIHDPLARAERAQNTVSLEWRMPLNQVAQWQIQLNQGFWTWFSTVVSPFSRGLKSVWAQDELFFPGFHAIGKKGWETDEVFNIAAPLGLSPNQLPYGFSGGNAHQFHTRSENRFLLIGDRMPNDCSIPDLMKAFRLPETRLKILPQLDYHQDLFLLPLNGSRVLVQDFAETQRFLKQALQQAETRKRPKDCARIKNLIEKTAENEEALKKAGYQSDKTIQRALQQLGLTPIPFPLMLGMRNPTKTEQRINHSDALSFANAFVHQLPDGTLVPILMETTCQTINELIQAEFLKLPAVSAVKAVASPLQDNGFNFLENQLTICYGGLHCLFADQVKGVELTA